MLSGQALFAFGSGPDGQKEAYIRYVCDLTRYYRRSPELISYEEVTDWVYHLPSFRLHLVLLSFPLNLLEFRDSGLRLLRKIQWIDLFIDEFRIRCLGIVRFCSAFIRSHSSRISPILPLRSLDIFEIQHPVRTSNLRLIGQRER